jgi:hypothetical protein
MFSQQSDAQLPIVSFVQPDNAGRVWQDTKSALKRGPAETEGRRAKVALQRGLGVMEEQRPKVAL